MDKCGLCGLQKLSGKGKEKSRVKTIVFATGEQLILEGSLPHFQHIKPHEKNSKPSLWAIGKKKVAE